MLSEQIYTNAKIVMQNEIIHGTLVVKNGYIDTIQSGLSSLPHAKNLNQTYLLPGFVELHTDNFEKYFIPRPGVSWPAISAMISHDSHLASAGITTVFNAFSIGDIHPKQERMNNLEAMTQAMMESIKKNITRIEHKIHLRCEVSHPEMLDYFFKLINELPVGLVSLMDHSPGQRQFLKFEKYYEYYQGKYGLRNDEMDIFTEQQLSNAEKYSESNRLAVAKYCLENSFKMASHDDATKEHVEESKFLGMSIAEFPTTAEAAKISHQHGLKVVMGAPNIVRGKSHSGNVSARDLIVNNCLDILSSDYYPTSLLQAVFLLMEEPIGYSFPNAVKLVSYYPAMAMDLDDRGELAPGKIADIIQVALLNSHPVIKRVWKKGERIF